jgi:hypothetical protein
MAYVERCIVDLQISRVGRIDTVGTYVFDTSRIRDGQELRRMLLFSRRLLLQEVSKRGFNILLIERWEFICLSHSRRHPEFFLFIVGVSPSCGKAIFTASRFDIGDVQREPRGRPNEAVYHHSSIWLTYIKTNYQYREVQGWIARMVITPLSLFFVAGGRGTLRYMREGRLIRAVCTTHQFSVICCSLSRNQ